MTGAAQLPQLFDDERKPNSKPSQCDKVLRYLKRRGTITPLDAMREYGIQRLAPRIGELEQRGYLFAHEWETSKNRDGDKVRYRRYRLLAGKL